MYICAPLCTYNRVYMYTATEYSLPPPVLAAEVAESARVSIPAAWSPAFSMTGMTDGATREQNQLNTSFLLQWMPTHGA